MLNRYGKEVFRVGAKNEKIKFLTIIPISKYLQNIDYLLLSISIYYYILEVGFGLFI